MIYENLINMVIKRDKTYKYILSFYIKTSDLSIEIQEQDDE